MVNFIKALLLRTVCELIGHENKSKVNKPIRLVHMAIPDFPHDICEYECKCNRCGKKSYWIY